METPFDKAMKMLEDQRQDIKQLRKDNMNLSLECIDLKIALEIAENDIRMLKQSRTHSQELIS